MGCVPGKFLCAACAGAFSPGVPSTFLCNYSAALELLSRLEAFCPGRAALAAFRGSAAYAAFLRRWKLGVYASLRFQVYQGCREGAEWSGRAKAAQSLKLGQALSMPEEALGALPCGRSASRAEALGGAG